MVAPETARVAALYIYPVKSCRGISVPSAEILKEGLQCDRRFMLVDAATHTFLTIRQNPRMTLIETDLLPTQHAHELIIRIKGQAGDVRVPACPDAAYLARHTKVETVSIWGASLHGHVFDASVSALLSRFLEQDVRLVLHRPETETRALRGNGDMALLGREGSVGYADVLPILMANLASLAELNARLVARGAAAIAMERFRPNIVLEARPAWDEDTWSCVSLVSRDTEGKIMIDCVCHCARCQVPNVGPDDGIKDKHEPWDTLMSYRRIDSGITFKPCFGMLCVPRGYDGLGGQDENVSVGRVTVGDILVIEERTHEHVYASGFTA